MLLERELVCEGVDVLEGIPEEDAVPVCPDAEGLDELLEVLLGEDELELEDELDELDDELEDEELDELDDELEDEELLLDDSCGEFIVTEVWHALNPRVSTIMLMGTIFMFIFMFVLSSNLADWK